MNENTNVTVNTANEESKAMGIIAEDIIHNAKERIISEMIALLEEYGHNATYYGCKLIVDTWFKNKQPIMEIFAKHPNWDAENFRIVFDQDFNRGFDSKAIKEFDEWVVDMYKREVVRPSSCTILGKTCGERESYADYTMDKATRILHLYRDYYLNPDDLVAGKTRFEWQMLRHELRCECYQVNNLLSESWDDYNDRGGKKPYGVWSGEYYPSKILRTMKMLKCMMSYLGSESVKSNILTEDNVTRIKQFFPDIRIGAGSTVMKAIRRVMNLPEFEKLRAWSTTEIKEWADNVTGELHSREVTISLDKKLSELGDQISPLTIRRHTIISFNPLDYLTMSFGHKWASCHTIDVNNYRNVPCSYHGEYCSGTISYMLDRSTLIFYTVDREYDGNAYETQDKMQRCVFSLSSDLSTMYQGRVYPDGRDGGDSSLASQFRAIMQQVVADSLDVPNYWLVKHGTSPCCEAICSEGTQYPDWMHCDDSSLSVLQGKETQTINVGHWPIDPDDGCVHDVSDQINGSSGGLRCAHCGDRMDRDDYGAIYCEDNDSWYCCESCAEDDGVHYCEDDDYGNGWHTTEYCYQDSYNERWYCGDPYITTDDGEYFSCAEHAWNADYCEVDDGNWYPVYDTFIDSYSEERYHIDDMEVDIDWEHQYVSVDNAEADGCVCVCDEWYASVEDAEADGWHYVEEKDEWMDDDDYAEYSEQALAEELEEDAESNDSESEVA